MQVLAMLTMICPFYVVEQFHDTIQSKVRGSNPTPSNTIATYLKNDSLENQFSVRSLSGKSFNIEREIIAKIVAETGIAQSNLSSWLAFYQESERIKQVSSVTDEEFEPEKLPLEGLLHVKRSPISEEKKTELAITASKLPERPTVGEIQRATRLIEQEPEITAEEAIERARGVTYLLPIPVDLMPKIREKSTEWELTIQEAIIRILREYLQ